MLKVTESARASPANLCYALSPNPAGSISQGQTLRMISKIAMRQAGVALFLVAGLAVAANHSTPGEGDFVDFRFARVDAPRVEGCKSFPLIRQIGRHLRMLHMFEKSSVHRRDFGLGASTMPACTN